MNIPFLTAIVWVLMVTPPALHPDDIFVIDETIPGVAELFQGDSFQLLGPPATPLEMEHCNANP